MSFGASSGLHGMETKNLDRYGHEPLPWSRARDALAAGAGPRATYFLGTVRPDGLPHAAGVGAVWVDDALWFTAGPATRKARNLAERAECTISVRLQGIDLVLEGRAQRVTDPETLEQIAAVYRSGHWPAQVENDAFTAPFSAPSAGPPPWHLYRFEIDTAFGVAGEEPYGASRWRFSA